MEKNFNNTRPLMYGKIIEFNGESGKIINQNGDIYIFSKRDLKDKNIKIGDVVSYRINYIKIGAEILTVVKFIKKI